MANTKSALKNIRKNKARYLQNRATLESPQNLGEEVSFRGFREECGPCKGTRVHFYFRIGKSKEKQLGARKQGFPKEITLLRITCGTR